MSPGSENLLQSSSSFTSANVQQQPPPPLPPRNTNRNAIHQNIALFDERSDANMIVDRRKIPSKLYENVIVKKSYDAELVAFYSMVKRIRSQHKYNDEQTNVGHIVASEFDNHYPENTEIKLLVHPLLSGSSATIASTKRNSNESDGSGKSNSNSNSNSSSVKFRNSSNSLSGTSVGDRNSVKLGNRSNVHNQKGQIEGYGPPVAFTCDSKSNIKHDANLYANYFHMFLFLFVFCSLYNS